MRTSYNGYVRIMIVESFCICYMVSERHGFASLPRRSPRRVEGPSASFSRRWNYNSAGAGLVHAFDSRRAMCELLASHNKQILACFPDQFD